MIGMPVIGTPPVGTPARCRGLPEKLAMLAALLLSVHRISSLVSLLVMGTPPVRALPRNQPPKLDWRRHCSMIALGLL